MAKRREAAEGGEESLLSKDMHNIKYILYGIEHFMESLK